MIYALVGNIVLCTIVVLGVIGWLALAIVRSRTEAPRLTADGNQHRHRNEWALRFGRTTARPGARPAQRRAQRGSHAFG